MWLKDFLSSTNQSQGRFGVLLLRRRSRGYRADSNRLVGSMVAGLATSYSRRLSRCISRKDSNGDLAGNSPLVRSHPDAAISSNPRLRHSTSQKGFNGFRASGGLRVRSRMDAATSLSRNLLHYLSTTRERWNGFQQDSRPLVLSHMDAVTSHSRSSRRSISQKGFSGFRVLSGLCVGFCRGAVILFSRHLPYCLLRQIRPYPSLACS